MTTTKLSKLQKTILRLAVDGIPYAAKYGPPHVTCNEIIYHVWRLPLMERDRCWGGGHAYFPVVPENLRRHLRGDWPAFDPWTDEQRRAIASVSRSCRRLKERGLIAHRNGKVWITDDGKAAVEDVGN